MLIAKKEWFVPWKHKHTCTCHVYTPYIYYGWWSNRYLIRSCVCRVQNDNTTVAKRKPEKTTAKVASITAMIYFHIILFLPIHIMIFIIFVTLIIIFSWIYNEPIQRHAFGLLAQLVRALNRYHRGQGFKSHTSLNFFQAFFLQLQKLHSITTMTYFHIILHPAVHIYDFHIFIT